MSKTLAELTGLVLMVRTALLLRAGSIASVPGLRWLDLSSESLIARSPHTGPQCVLPITVFVERGAGVHGRTIFVSILLLPVRCFLITARLGTPHSFDLACTLGVINHPPKGPSGFLT